MKVRNNKIQKLAILTLLRTDHTPYSLSAHQFGSGGGGGNSNSSSSCCCSGSSRSGGGGSSSTYEHRSDGVST